MAHIRFTAAERPGLLADAVLASVDEIDSRAFDGLRDLAAALKGSNGKAFDEALMEHFPRVALDRIGVEHHPPAVGVDPATGGEAEVER